MRATDGPTIWGQIFIFRAVARQPAGGERTKINLAPDPNAELLGIDCVSHISKLQALTKIFTRDSSPAAPSNLQQLSSFA
jgi:hypothetical protein